MSDSDDHIVTHVAPRETEIVPLELPVDALATLREIAGERDMSLEALLRFYIGQGVRQDISRRYGERLLRNAERVLARHIESEHERSEILREIREVKAA
jgi:hypothetical protein